MEYIEIEGDKVEPVTLIEAKNLLGVDFDWKDDEISRHITAAREQAESYTKMALVRKTLRLYFDRPVDAFEVPCPPLIRLVKATAYLKSGEETELPLSDFLTWPSGRLPGRIEMLRGAYDLDLRDRRGISIDVEAGYSLKDCPAAIKDAIGFFVQNRYDRIPFDSWQKSFFGLLQKWRLYDL